MTLRGAADNRLEVEPTGVVTGPGVRVGAGLTVAATARGKVVVGRLVGPGWEVPLPAVWELGPPQFITHSSIVSKLFSFPEIVVNTEHRMFSNTKLDSESKKGVTLTASSGLRAAV